MYFKTIYKYRKHVKEILIRFFDKQLRYKSEKCEFYKKKVIFLGFLVGREEIKIDLSKIAKILDWPQSKNLKKL